MQSNALSAEFREEILATRGVEDRRGASRIRAVLFVVRVVRDGDAGLFRMQNLSDSGLLIVAHVEFAAGERVSISLLEDLTVRGTVMWYDGHKCGIRFDWPIDSEAVLRAGAERRTDRRGRAMRLPAARLATSYAENGIRPVRITDVSQGGVGFKHDGTFRPGMFVKFILEGGTERSGVVRWAEDRHGGVYLVEPLNCRELQSVRDL
ncbi:MAG: hypothetical protein B7Z08_11615 [Sphingomonadales bacterium 32-68-7]|nr:MAG: hypothetical protein B7Z33_07705 [Sphingomonadales bacterium 12-68-11]OYX07846.1 MAG: hypothetical protein B7Z08_11615 [Sphingomonadales bacterium 32-68-7]